MGAGARSCHLLRVEPLPGRDLLCSVLLQPVWDSFGLKMNFVPLSPEHRGAVRNDGLGLAMDQITTQHDDKGAGRGSLGLKKKWPTVVHVRQQQEYTSHIHTRSRLDREMPSSLRHLRKASLRCPNPAFGALCFDASSSAAIFRWGFFSITKVSSFLFEQSIPRLRLHQEPPARGGLGSWPSSTSDLTLTCTVLSAGSLAVTRTLDE